MTHFMPKRLRALALICVLTSPSLVLAGEWVVETNPMGPGYVVTDHETGTIVTKSEKAAKKVAKALNQAESSKGFVDPGTGPCHTGALC